MDRVPPAEFTELRRRARSRLLTMHFESGVGHIGGNLSALDLLLTLSHQILRPEDRLVLSKGHAAGALYVTLWTLGILSDEDLCRFHCDGGKLSGHPAPNWLPEIPFATGSLGHGLSLAAGMALGRTLRRSPGRVYCLLSDGEWEEGSTWEALLFALRRQTPLTFLIDANGLQGFGTTAEVAGLEPLVEKLRGFGTRVQEIDGHDPDAVIAACSAVPPGVQGIVARTVKGHGVSFMENRMEWHYLPLSPEQYRQALREVESVR